MKRRDFLSQGAQLGVSLACLQLSGCSGAPELSTTPSPATGDYSYKLGDWTGDTFAPMHKIRDGFHADLPKPEKKVDLLVIGAGLAGLSLAWFCRDREVLVLERESAPGGNAKSENYKGIEYALGSAYLVDLEEPFGSLYRDLGMEMKPLPHPTESVWTPGGWKTLEEGPQKEAVERLQKVMKDMLAGPDYPLIPLQKASKKAIALDDLTYHDWLAKDYPEYIPMAEEYCWTALGGPCKKISAYVGVSSLSELVTPIYALPGGNAAVAKKLAEKVGSDRLMTGQSVFRVEPDGRVGFFDTHAENPQVRCIQADHVALACPYYFGARLIPWADAKATGIMRSMEYGSYMVVNMCFDAPVFRQAYDHWAPGNDVWADFVDADYTTGKAVGDATVLTVYAPFRDVAAGRVALLQGDGAGLARKVVDDIQTRVGFPKEHLKEVRITRYGHQIFCSRQGVVRRLLSLERNHGKIHLCHSDGQGCAAVESAISESYALSQRLKKKT